MFLRRRRPLTRTAMLGGASRRAERGSVGRDRLADAVTR
jgi:hypothetical protein